jgi:hypothetical protein
MRARDDYLPAGTLAEITGLHPGEIEVIQGVNDSGERFVCGFID